jgi:hypothetical protein
MRTIAEILCIAGWAYSFFYLPNGWVAAGLVFFFGAALTALWISK